MAKLPHTSETRDALTTTDGRDCDLLTLNHFRGAAVFTSQLLTI